MNEQDLSSLPALKILLSEKNISRAADKMGLSQPAMSRTFARLKKQFDDPLMVRSNKQYQLTPKGQRILQQLHLLMPQLENLWQAQDLDLQQIEQVVTIAGTDMDIVFISKNLHKIQGLAPKLRFTIRNSTPRGAR